MTRYVKHATLNNCYKAADKVTPVGILVHSTGAINKSLKRYVNYPSVCGVNANKNYWDQPRPEGQNICVHAFLGETAAGTVATVEILPLSYAAWGCGKGEKGSYNYDPTAHIQLEICEGNSIDKEYFEAVWDEAVDYCVWLCKKHGWKSASVITSHREAAQKGYASAHSDPADYFGKFGRNMDMLRAAVQEKLTPPAASTPASTISVAKGKKLALNGVGLYASAYSKAPVRYLNGVYYCYDGVAINGFVRICPSAANVGKLPLVVNVTGYVRIAEIK